MNKLAPDSFSSKEEITISINKKEVDSKEYIKTLLPKADIEDASQKVYDFMEQLALSEKKS